MHPDSLVLTLCLVCISARHPSSLFMPVFHDFPVDVHPNCYVGHITMVDPPFRWESFFAMVTSAVRIANWPFTIEKSN